MKKADGIVRRHRLKTTRNGLDGSPNRGLSQRAV